MNCEPPQVVHLEHRNLYALSPNRTWRKQGESYIGSWFSVTLDAPYHTIISGTKVLHVSENMKLTLTKGHVQHIVLMTLSFEHRKLHYLNIAVSFRWQTTCSQLLLRDERLRQDFAHVHQSGLRLRIALLKKRVENGNLQDIFLLTTMVRT